MKKTILSAVVIAALGASVSTSAIASDELSPNYDHLSFAYTDYGDGLDSISLWTEGSFNNNWFTEARIERASVENIDITQLNVGFGYAYNVTGGTDFTFSAGALYLRGDVAFGSGITASTDELGYYASAGVKSRITKNLELRGRAVYGNVDDISETSYEAMGRYYFGESWGVDAGMTFNSDDEAWFVGISYRF